MTNIIEHKDDNNQLVYRINKKTKVGKYYVVVPDRQGEHINNPIKINGFARLPSGFWKEGYGLTGAGYIVLEEVYNNFNKKINLTITNSTNNKIDARGNIVKMELSHKSLSKINEALRTIKRDRNASMRVEVKHFLGNTFHQLRKLKSESVGYIPGKLSEILEQKSILNKLNLEDRAALEKLIPDYLSKIPGTLRAKSKLKIIYESMDAGRKVYLSKVIEDFKKRLESDSKTEAVWQQFLSEYILVFRQNYGEVLEKESVSFKGKFPDFMLVDPYGYIDIYEIKKPSTGLLNLDKGRKNYYWGSEISRAIAQVEKYSHLVQRHADGLITDIRNSKGIDVNIVRPRGYIIAGRRSQLTSQSMKDDFRILCDSLSNIDVILYDDLVDSLEAFISKT